MEYVKQGIQQGSKISVMLVDDYPMWLQVLRDILGNEADIEVAGEASNGADALYLIESIAPDVVILDVNLPGMNGQEIAAHLRGRRHHSALIMLTAYNDWEQALLAIRHGAVAFCAKDIQAERLVEVVRLVAQGYYVVGEKSYDVAGIKQWAAEVVESLTGPNSIDAESHYTPLSPREMEILRCVTQGKSNQEIALTLAISQQTVKNHMTSILRKLDVQDRTQAAVYAIWRGWVRKEDMFR